jgi:hypothetical protein
MNTSRDCIVYEEESVNKELFETLLNMTCNLFPKNMKGMDIYQHFAYKYEITPNDA